jgi:uncharacterized protein
MTPLCQQPRRPARIIKAVVRLATLLVLLWTAPAAGAEAQQPQVSDTIRALYITGGGFHDFAGQQEIIPPGIAARAPIEWTIDHTAGTSTDTLIARHENTDWADEFDVVVYNMSFSFVVDPAWIERIAHAHRDKGVAAVILHGATHSYRRSTTLAWKELMGAASMRHDRQRELVLERILPEHPIVRDLPAGWDPGMDELYAIERTWPSMTPLLQAWSVETEEHHPVAWTNTFGNARVFVTSMGHNNATMADPVYLDLVTRGLLWTLGRLPDALPAAATAP